MWNGRERTQDRWLAVLGTLTVAFPVAATVATGVVESLRSGAVRVDYLMPAELFVLVAVGGVLLSVASLRTRRRRRLILGAATTAAVGIATAVGVAWMTGLASGATEATGWPFAFALGALVVYDVAVVVLAVAGARLTIDLSRRPPRAAGAA
jgi:hypothetical protein